jgi:photosystem II stability/assembly factor-like uncharacterized protein
MSQVSKETASQIAVAHVKKQKYTEKIDVAAIEENSKGWIVRGTCPIDVGGHPWAEKFEVHIDLKGKVKSADYALL